MEWSKAGFAPFPHMGVSGPRADVCLFVGYSRSTRGGLFYSPQDKKVFVSTNATFLENTYMTDFKPRSKTVLEELQSDGSDHHHQPLVNDNTERPPVQVRISWRLVVVGGL